jgi:predicted ATPase
MLTRLYIDNYRSFVNFECKFDRRHLILGANGAGKSSLADALGRIRRFVIDGDGADSVFPESMRTRWMGERDQKWEVETRLDGKVYLYSLTIMQIEELAEALIIREFLHLDGKPLVEFNDGEVRLYDDAFQERATYPFDPSRSALSTINNRRDGQAIERFKSWLSDLHCFRLNPFGMKPWAEKEERVPEQSLSNFASWYRHLAQEDPRQLNALFTDLAACFPDFRQLRVESAGESVRELMAEFGTKFGFGELSDGQRCLICLYAILRFLLQKGGTIMIDEPDNFVSLREIQPWLRAADDILDGGVGQLFLISHHPEILNQWAPSYGLQLFREDGGPTRARKFEGGAGSALTPAELIARGWDDV